MAENEYILRLVIAGALGALIGLEREKRFKEAGLRTHFLVAIGSAVFMIVSKYAFLDIVGGDIRLDPSRIAAAVPSGIGFLGAGMILVQRTSIHGLTTAAGIWATAGIGLAVGAGMYEIAIVAGLLVIIGLEFLKILFRPIIPKETKLIVDTVGHQTVHKVIDELTRLDIAIKDYQVNLKKDDDDVGCSVLVRLRTQNNLKENKVISLLQEIEGVTAIKLAENK